MKMNLTELQGERCSCCEEGFKAPQKVQKTPLLSPKVDSAAGVVHHQCRICSEMPVGRYECICMHNEDKLLLAGKPDVKEDNK